MTLMKKLFNRLKCLFGFHEYTFMETPFGERHYCIHCGYWEEEKEWKDYFKRSKE